MKVVVDDIPPEGLDWKSCEEGSAFSIEEEEERLSFSSPVKTEAYLLPFVLPGRRA